MKPLITIPGEEKCKQQTLPLNHDARDLAEDRMAAKKLYNNKESCQINNRANFYRLSSIAEKFKSSLYRRSVNNNFITHFYKWEDEFVFKYKTFCRGDKIHCYDAFADQMKCLKRKEFLKSFESKSVVDWICAVPLHVKYHISRRLLRRPEFSLGRQPLNMICEPLVLHRVEFGLNFRGDRFLAPMMLVLNWHEIRRSMSNRLLSIQSRLKEELEHQIETFVNENYDYWNDRRKKSKPLLSPLAHVDPFSFWNRKRATGKDKNRSSKTHVRHFSLGPLKPHHIVDELNQFPSDFPSHFHILKALSYKRLKITKFPPVKENKDDETRLRIRESYPNVFVEKLDLLDIEDYGAPGHWVTIEPTIYQYGPDPAVTFRRGLDYESLVAQTMFPEEYDNESLESVAEIGRHLRDSTPEPCALAFWPVFAGVPRVHMARAMYTHSFYPSTVHSLF